MTRRWFTEDTLGLLLIVALVLFYFFPYVDPTFDNRRKQDIDLLNRALSLYAQKEGGLYQVFGAGWQGTGTGWVNDQYGSSPSVVRTLHEKGYLNVPSLDDPVQRPSYMIYVCDGGQRYALFATLDKPSRSEIANARTRCNGQGPSGAVELYGKNYAIGN